MKVYNYIFLMLTMIFLFHIAGIPTGYSATLEAIGYVNNQFNFLGSTFYLLAIATLTLATVGGIIVGIVNRSQVENFILVAFVVSTLVFFTGSLISISTYAVGNFETWLSSLILIMVMPLTVGYVISLLEFFRGTD